MKINQLTLALRPRDAYEAMDLGFVLARSCWKQLYIAWFSLLLPLFVLIQMLEVFNVWLVTLIIWWSKPLYDRIALFVYSRVVFGETPTVRDVWRAVPGFFRTGLISALTYRRIDLARSFNLPVFQLERLRGKARRARQKILNKNTRPKAVWLAVACVHFESVLSLSLVAILYLMTPRTAQEQVREFIFSGDAPVWFGLLTNMFYFMAISMVEPFYVAAGFVLYLNRRTQIEGWDIELAFHGIRENVTALEKSTAT